MRLEEHILETFILVLLESDTKNHGKNLIRTFIVQIIIMLVSINMVLDAEHRYDFGRIRVGLMK